jgi:nicotinate-nucleotide pyrophosphorylase (carboxylating)
VIARALAEDVGSGDVTTDAIVPADLRGSADVVVREAGVICGLDQAFAVLLELDPQARMERLAQDGDLVTRPPRVVARMHASLRALLTGERTALNLLQRMSGIATTTRRYADLVAGTDVQLLDTRKTAPGLRALDKHAVACGGGTNHRAGLHDAVLIKDNHVAAAGSVGAALAAARALAPDLPCEVEVDSLEQLDEVLALQAELVLLDNFDVATTAEAVRRRGDRPTGLESSGGLVLANAREYAETGVDFISVGGLTHSVTALDLGLDLAASPPVRG